jgi:3-deoxy-D-manno-octulosonic-acid transferase
MQTQEDARGIIELGINPDKIKITGNIKFDALDEQNVPRDERGKYYNQLALENRRLLVAGSTHKGEEEILIKVYHELSLKEKGWILLIAPRHLERIKEVEEIARRYNYQPVKISDIAKVDKKDTYIYILDIMGELKTFYALADLVFVGGSLIPFGGHNLIEPAYFSKAIIFGEYVFNFQDIADELATQEAAIRVRNVQELKDEINNLVNNREKMTILGQKARRVVMSNLGATERNVQEIEKILK